MRVRIGGSWGGGEGSFHAVEDGVGEREKGDFSSSTFCVELSKDALNDGCRSSALAHFSMTDGVKFRPVMLGGGNLIGLRCTDDDLSRSSLLPLQLAEVIGVEVEPSHRASRSSESPMAQSSSLWSCPDLRSASYSGRSFRFCQYAMGGDAGGVFSSAAMALSSRWMVSCVSERR